MLNKHNFQQPQVNKGMFTDVATLLLRTNIFLAAMSSSSSDNVTQSVRPSVRVFVRVFVHVFVRVLFLILSLQAYLTFPL